MHKKKLSIDDMRELIHLKEFTDPLIFLESIMTGQDPREHSELYNLACEIDEFSNGEPTPDDWCEIFERIKQVGKYKVVSLSESITASKTLAEYLHAKKKQIDISGNNGDTLTSASPLTLDEIEVFKGRFNADY